MKKPRIVKAKGRWLCDGIAFGNTPLEAYSLWERLQICVVLMEPPQLPEKLLSLIAESGEDSMTKPQRVRSRFGRFWSEWKPGIIALAVLVLCVVARGYT